MKAVLNACLLALTLVAKSQEPVLAYDFNTGRIEENQRRVEVRAPGTTMASDRFGNANSAVFIQGHQTCYLNLDQIKSYEKGDPCVLTMSNHEVFAVSRRRKTEILGRLKIM